MSKLYNLAAMTVSSTGTGPITLNAAAVIGGVRYLTFDAAGVQNSETVSYSINDTNQSEAGDGVYTTSTKQLTRGPVSSTNANAAINMTAAAIVKISPKKQDLANLREDNTFTGTQTITPAAGTLNRGLSIVTSGPASGSVVGPYAANQIDMSFFSTVTGSASPYADHGVWQTECCAFRVNATFGGANLNGESFNAGFFHTRVESDTNPAGDGDFIGCLGMVNCNHAVDANGALHGIVGYTQIDTGASVRVINGLFAEADIENGGVCVQRRGVCIVSHGHGTASGDDDCAIAVGTAFNSGAFKHGIRLNTGGGSVNPIQSTGSLVRSDGAMTLANVFDCSNMTITGKIMDFANFTVSGAGVLKAGAGTADANTGAMVQASVTSGGIASLISQVNSTTGLSGLHVANAGNTSNLFAVSFEASNTSTLFGITRGNWSELVTGGGASNGLLIGCANANPIVFGTNGTEYMRLLTGLNLGGTTDPGVGSLTMSGNLSVKKISASYGSSAGNSIVVNNTTDMAGSGNVDISIQEAGVGASSWYFLRLMSNAASDNEFLFRGDGTALCDGSWTGGGADYAEYFEWADGNPKNEDRRGLSVVLVGAKIRVATAADAKSSIIGVVSARPTVVGDAAHMRWKDKYLRDEYGADLMEDAPFLSWIELRQKLQSDPDAPELQQAEPPAQDESEAQAAEEPAPEYEEIPHRYFEDSVPQGVVVPQDAVRSTEQRRVLNPAYDPESKYTSREDRPEWSPIGLMGKLVVRKGQPVGDRWIKLRDVSANADQWLVR